MKKIEQEPDIKVILDDTVKGKLAEIEGRNKSFVIQDVLSRAISDKMFEENSDEITEVVIPVGGYPDWLKEEILDPQRINLYYNCNSRNFDGDF